MPRAQTGGEQYYLAISNNRRNARLPTFLAVRLTTTRKSPLPSVVQLTDTDTPWTGAISADDIDTVYGDEVTRDYGPFRPPRCAASTRHCASP